MAYDFRNEYIFKKMHVTDRSVCTMKYAFFLFLFHFYYVMAIILIDQKFS